MFSDPDNGIVIGDGRSGLRLTRAGPRNELGWPTRIEVRAGPFSGSVRDDGMERYGVFRTQLVRLREALTGMARLQSHDGFDLRLTGGSLGAVAVEAVVVAAHVPLIRLEFGFAIDQSYLPAIIRRIGAEFPDD